MEQLKWFLLPSEAARHLAGLPQTTPTAAPFQPRTYSNRSCDMGKIPHKEQQPQNGVETEQPYNGIETESSASMAPAAASRLEWKPKFHHPPKNILKPTIEVWVWRYGGMEGGGSPYIHRICYTSLPIRLLKSTTCYVMGIGYWFVSRGERTPSPSSTPYGSTGSSLQPKG